MIYLPNFIPLDDEGDSDGRSRHDLVIDKIIDGWFSDGLDDSKMYLVEKDYYHTVDNISPDEVYLRGQIAGDFDIAIYDIDDKSFELKEIKGNKKVPGEMSQEDRRANFQIIDDGHDQLAKAREKIDRVATSYQLDIDVEQDIETELVVWSDKFEDHSFNSQSLPNYQGFHTHTQDAYQKARNSEAFDALNQGLFNGNMLESGEKIERR